MTDCAERPVANADQAEFWNSALAEKWVTHQADLDQRLRLLGEALISRAAIRRGERVIDVGCGTAQTPQYKLCGEYGDHLKAIVEAFVAAAKELLLGPSYIIHEGRTQREVPRMAFRLEIVDEFRIDGLAREIYRDLVRYRLFMRDSRGKSVRGTFIPRLYLRRLLLPYCALALSRRDSVPLSCNAFIQLLLEPDMFKAAFTTRRARDVVSDAQILIPFPELPPTETRDPAYDDLAAEDMIGPSTDRCPSPYDAIDEEL